MKPYLSFLKKSRQQLRTLAKDVMSSSDYAIYINEESTWENQVDENVLSIKNMLFSTHQATNSDLSPKTEEDQKVQSTLETPIISPIIENVLSEEVPSVEREEHFSERSENSDEVINQEFFVQGRNKTEEKINAKEIDAKEIDAKEIDAKEIDVKNINAENITEELIENQIDDVEKNTKSSVDTSKPFHMNIQNGTSRKRRRSIFRRRKEKKQEEIQPLPKGQTLHSFSDGIRNIISQVSNSKNIKQNEIKPQSNQLLEEVQGEEISTNEMPNNTLFSKDDHIKEGNEKEDVIKISTETNESRKPSQLFALNLEIQSEDSLLFDDILEEKQDILDADSLDLDLNVDMFHDLPPPIPEYFDTESTKLDSIESNEMFPDIRTQKQDHAVTESNGLSFSERQKDIAYYTNQLLTEPSISKRVELFMGRLSIHLQKQNWLEGSSDAFMILVLDSSQRKKVADIMASYELPAIYQNRIKSSFDL